MLVAAVRRRIRQVVHAEARSHRLTPQKFWMLLALDEAGPMSLGAVADRLRMDPPTASRVVASLTRAGLVQLAEDPLDRRRLLIATAPRGAELAGRLRPLARDLREAVIAGFSPAEIAAVRNALRRMLGNLDRFEARRSSRRTVRAAQPQEEKEPS